MLQRSILRHNRYSARQETGIADVMVTPRPGRIVAIQTFTLDSLIDVQTLPPTGSLHGCLDASESECADLAARFGFLEVRSLTADMRVFQVAKGSWDVRGKLLAQVVQACGVTGEPVVESVDFVLEERYVQAAGPEDEIFVDLDEAEPLNGGRIDLGEMVAQSLALAVTPWPRSEEAPASFQAGEDDRPHPFAGLASLKSSDT